MNYNILLKRLFIVFKSQWIFAALKGKLLSFASFEILSNTKKNAKNFNTILDIGANKGQFTSATQYFYPNAQIYSFEPIPSVFKELEKALEKSKNKVKVFNMALGNEEGVIKFNKNKYNHSSSILNISKENDNFPSNEVEQIDVQISTLDAMNEKLTLESPVLLKLDVQGFELETLKGGINTIANHIDYIIIEANLEKLYDKQPTFTEINQFLNQHGFELESLLDFNMGKYKNYIEMDLLYKRNK